MRKTEKYQGIFPAFYACYDEQGDISPERTKALTRYFIGQGVKGVYVGGSSGECIYQSVEDRKRTLESVMEEAKGELTIIAHVACNSTRDSQELARHAEALGVDAIAAIPPIYFHLPEYAIERYWNDISSAAPRTDFIIYNIPQLAGTALSLPMLENMLKNPRVIGVKNSSMPVQDIQMFKDAGTQMRDDFVVFNGADEQLMSGIAIGADGGIGGTYGVMPALYVKLFELVKQGDLQAARELQYAVNRIIYAMCAGRGSMYAFIKEVIRRRTGLDLGGVRAPLYPLAQEDMPQVERCVNLVEAAAAKYL